MSDTATTTAVPAWTLGDRLAKALRVGGLTANEMAEMLGYHRATISRYLHDKGERPRRAVLAQWSLATGVPLEWITTGETSGDGPDDGATLAAPKRGGGPTVI